MITHGNNKIYTIKYFHSNMCKICREMSVYTQKINEKYNIKEVDTNKSQSNYNYTKSLGVYKIPAYVIFKKDKPIAIYQNINERKDVERIRQAISIFR
ncbi:MAG: hypothetical protein K9L17_13360 [Clostridiales bacterium]|nr:hypothetical protein [Clostridiales bacterium]